MAPLPQIPAFTIGDSQLWRLQQLSAAVAFACRAPVIFHLYKTAGAFGGTNTQTAVSWDAASADSDGGWSATNPTRYTAQTPGYFHMDTGVNAGQSNTTDSQMILSLRVTTGPGNPNGAGGVTWIGSRGDDMTIGTGSESLTVSAGTPFLYAGDYVEVMVLTTILTAITAPWNGSGNNDLNGFPDGSPSFTGMLVSPGAWNPRTGTWGP